MAQSDILNNKAIIKKADLLAKEISNTTSLDTIKERDAAAKAASNINDMTEGSLSKDNADIYASGSSAIINAAGNATENIRQNQEIRDIQINNTYNESNDRAALLRQRDLDILAKANEIANRNADEKYVADSTTMLHSGLSGQQAIIEAGINATRNQGYDQSIESLLLRDKLVRNKEGLSPYDQYSATMEQMAKNISQQADTTGKIASSLASQEKQLADAMFMQDQNYVLSKKVIENNYEQSIFNIERNYKYALDNNLLTKEYADKLNKDTSDYLRNEVRRDVETYTGQLEYGVQQYYDYILPDLIEKRMNLSNRIAFASGYGTNDIAQIGGEVVGNLHLHQAIINGSVHLMDSLLGAALSSISPITHGEFKWVSSHKFQRLAKIMGMDSLIYDHDSTATFMDKLSFGYILYKTLESIPEMLYVGVPTVKLAGAGYRALVAERAILANGEKVSKTILNSIDKQIAILKPLATVSGASAEIRNQYKGLLQLRALVSAKLAGKSSSVRISAETGEFLKLGTSYSVSNAALSSTIGKFAKFYKTASKRAFASEIASPLTALAIDYTRRLNDLVSSRGDKASLTFQDLIGAAVHLAVDVASISKMLGTKAYYKNLTAGLLGEPKVTGAAAFGSALGHFAGGMLYEGAGEIVQTWTELQARSGWKLPSIPEIMSASYDGKYGRERRALEEAGGVAFFSAGLITSTQRIAAFGADAITNRADDLLERIRNLGAGTTYTPDIETAEDLDALVTAVASKLYPSSSTPPSSGSTGSTTTGGPTSPGAPGATTGSPSTSPSAHHAAHSPSGVKTVESARAEAAALREAAVKAEEELEKAQQEVLKEAKDEAKDRAKKALDNTQKQKNQGLENNNQNRISQLTHRKNELENKKDSLTAAEQAELAAINNTIDALTTHDVLNKGYSYARAVQEMNKDGKLGDIDAELDALASARDQDSFEKAVKALNDKLSKNDNLNDKKNIFNQLKKLQESKENIKSKHKDLGKGEKKSSQKSTDKTRKATGTTTATVDDLKEQLRQAQENKNNATEKDDIDRYTAEISSLEQQIADATNTDKAKTVSMEDADLIDEALLDDYLNTVSPEARLFARLNYAREQNNGKLTKSFERLLRSFAIVAIDHSEFSTQNSESGIRQKNQNKDKDRFLPNLGKEIIVIPTRAWTEDTGNINYSLNQNLKNALHTAFDQLNLTTLAAISDGFKSIVNSIKKGDPVDPEAVKNLAEKYRSYLMKIQNHSLFLHIVLESNKNSKIGRTIKRQMDVVAKELERIYQDMDTLYNQQGWATKDAHDNIISSIDQILNDKAAGLDGFSKICEMIKNTSSSLFRHLREAVAEYESARNASEIETKRNEILKLIQEVKKPLFDTFNVFFSDEFKQIYDQTIEYLKLGGSYLQNTLPSHITFTVNSHNISLPLLILLQNEVFEDLFSDLQYNEDLTPQNLIETLLIARLKNDTSNMSTLLNLFAQMGNLFSGIKIAIPIIHETADSVTGMKTSTRVEQGIEISLQNLIDMDFETACDLQNVIDPNNTLDPDKKGRKFNKERAKDEVYRAQCIQTMRAKLSEEFNAENSNIRKQILTRLSAAISSNTEVLEKINALTKIGITAIANNIVKGNTDIEKLGITKDPSDAGKAILNDITSNVISNIKSMFKDQEVSNEDKVVLAQLAYDLALTFFKSVYIGDNPNTQLIDSQHKTDKKGIKVNVTRVDSKFLELLKSYKQRLNDVFEFANNEHFESNDISHVLSVFETIFGKRIRYSNRRALMINLQMTGKIMYDGKNKSLWNGVQQQLGLTLDQFFFSRFAQQINENSKNKEQFAIVMNNYLSLPLEEREKINKAVERIADSKKGLSDPNIGKKDIELAQQHPACYVMIKKQNAKKHTVTYSDGLTEETEMLEEEIRYVFSPDLSILNKEFFKNIKVSGLTGYEMFNNSSEGLKSVIGAVMDYQNSMADAIMKLGNANEWVHNSGKFDGNMSAYKAYGMKKDGKLQEINYSKPVYSVNYMMPNGRTSTKESNTEVDNKVIREFADFVMPDEIVTGFKYDKDPTTGKTVVTEIREKNKDKEQWGGMPVVAFFGRLLITASKASNADSIHDSIKKQRELYFGVLFALLRAFNVDFDKMPADIKEVSLSHEETIKLVNSVFGGKKSVDEQIKSLLSDSQLKNTADKINALLLLRDLYFDRRKNDKKSVINDIIKRHSFDKNISENNIIDELQKIVDNSPDGSKEKTEAEKDINVLQNFNTDPEFKNKVNAIDNNIDNLIDSIHYKIKIPSHTDEFDINEILNGLLLDDKDAIDNFNILYEHFKKHPESVFSGHPGIAMKNLETFKNAIDAAAKNKTSFVEELQTQNLYVYMDGKATFSAENSVRMAGIPEVDALGGVYRGAAAISSIGAYIIELRQLKVLNDMINQFVKQDQDRFAFYQAILESKGVDIYTSNIGTMTNAMRALNNTHSLLASLYSFGLIDRDMSKPLIQPPAYGSQAKSNLEKYVEESQILFGHAIYDLMSWIKSDGDSLTSKIRELHKEIKNKAKPEKIEALKLEISNLFFEHLEKYSKELASSSTSARKKSIIDGIIDYLGKDKNVIPDFLFESDFIPITMIYKINAVEKSDNVFDIDSLMSYLYRTKEEADRLNKKDKVDNFYKEGLFVREINSLVDYYSYFDIPKNKNGEAVALTSRLIKVAQKVIDNIKDDFSMYHFFKSIKDESFIKNKGPDDITYFTISYENVANGSVGYTIKLNEPAIEALFKIKITDKNRDKIKEIIYGVVQFYNDTDGSVLSKHKPLDIRSTPSLAVAKQNNLYNSHQRNYMEELLSTTFVEKLRDVILNISNKYGITDIFETKEAQEKFMDMYNNDARFRRDFIALKTKVIGQIEDILLNAAWGKNPEMYMNLFKDRPNFDQIAQTMKDAKSRVNQVFHFLKSDDVDNELMSLLFTKVSTGINNQGTVNTTTTILDRAKLIISDVIGLWNHNFESTLVSAAQNPIGQVFDAMYLNANNAVRGMNTWNFNMGDTARSSEVMSPFIINKFVNTINLIRNLSVNHNGLKRVPKSNGTKYQYESHIKNIENEQDRQDLYNRINYLKTAIRHLINTIDPSSKISTLNIRSLMMSANDLLANQNNSRLIRQYMKIINNMLDEYSDIIKEIEKIINDKNNGVSESIKKELIQFIDNEKNTQEYTVLGDKDVNIYKLANKEKRGRDNRKNNVEMSRNKFLTACSNFLKETFGINLSNVGDNMPINSVMNKIKTAINEIYGNVSDDILSNFSSMSRTHRVHDISYLINESRFDNTDKNLKIINYLVENGLIDNPTSTLVKNNLKSKEKVSVKDIIESVTKVLFDKAVKKAKVTSDDTLLSNLLEKISYNDIMQNVTREQDNKLNYVILDKIVDITDIVQSQKNILLSILSSDKFKTEFNNELNSIKHSINNDAIKINGIPRKSIIAILADKSSDGRFVLTNFASVKMDNNLYLINENFSNELYEAITGNKPTTPSSPNPGRKGGKTRKAVSDTSSHSGWSEEFYQDNLFLGVDSIDTIVKEIIEAFTLYDKTSFDVWLDDNTKVSVHLTSLPYDIDKGTGHLDIDMIMYDDEGNITYEDNISRDIYRNAFLTDVNGEMEDSLYLSERQKYQMRQFLYASLGAIAKTQSQTTIDTINQIRAGKTRKAVSKRSPGDHTSITRDISSSAKRSTKDEYIAGVKEDIAAMKAENSDISEELDAIEEAIDALAENITEDLEITENVTADDTTTLGETTVNEGRTQTDIKISRGKSLTTRLHELWHAMTTIGFDALSNDAKYWVSRIQNIHSAVKEYFDSLSNEEREALLAELGLDNQRYSEIFNNDQLASLEEFVGYFLSEPKLIRFLSKNTAFNQFLKERNRKSIQVRENKSIVGKIISAFTELLKAVFNAVGDRIEREPETGMQMMMRAVAALSQHNRDFELAEKGELTAEQQEFSNRKLTRINRRISSALGLIDDKVSRYIEAQKILNPLFNYDNAVSEIKKDIAPTINKLNAEIDRILTRYENVKGVRGRVLQTFAVGLKLLQATYYNNIGLTSLRDNPLKREVIHNIISDLRQKLIENSIFDSNILLDFGVTSTRYLKDYVNAINRAMGYRQSINFNIAEAQSNIKRDIKDILSKPEYIQQLASEDPEFYAQYSTGANRFIEHLNLADYFWGREFNENEAEELVTYILNNNDYMNSKMRDKSEALIERAVGMLGQSDNTALKNTIRKLVRSMAYTRISDKRDMFGSQNIEQQLNVLDIDVNGHSDAMNLLHQAITLESILAYRTDNQDEASAYFSEKTETFRKTYNNANETNKSEIEASMKEAIKLYKFKYDQLFEQMTLRWKDEDVQQYIRGEGTQDLYFRPNRDMYDMSDPFESKTGGAYYDQSKKFYEYNNKVTMITVNPDDAQFNGDIREFLAECDILEQKGFTWLKESGVGGTRTYIYKGWIDMNDHHQNGAFMMRHNSHQGHVIQYLSSDEMAHKPILNEAFRREHRDAMLSWGQSFGKDGSLDLQEFYGNGSFKSFAGSETMTRDNISTKEFESLTEVDTTMESSLAAMEKIIQENKIINLNNDLLYQQIIMSDQDIRANRMTRPTEDELPHHTEILFRIEADEHGDPKVVFNRSLIDKYGINLTRKDETNFFKMLQAMGEWDSAVQRGNVYVDTRLLQMMFGFDVPTYTELTNDNPRTFKAIRMVQTVMREMVKETRNNTIIRNPALIFENFKSNILGLVGEGVSPTEIAKLVPYYTNELKRYLRDTRKSIALENELALLKKQEYQDTATEGADIQQRRVELLEEQLKSLRSGLKNNVVAPLMEAGMYSNIVEDSEQDNASLIDKAVNILMDTKGVSSSKQNLIRELTLAPSSDLYNTMAELTRLGDFIPRVILYYHLTGKEGVDKRIALDTARDRFINYNTPLWSKLLRLLDRFGWVNYTKYAFAVEKQILSVFRKAPVNALGILGIQLGMEAMGFGKISTLSSYLGESYAVDGKLPKGFMTGHFGMFVQNLNRYNYILP